MNRDTTKGHLAALLTILIWGTTFISTKVLLTDFQPVEILFFRFVAGTLALFLVCPRLLKGTTWKQEERLNIGFFIGFLVAMAGIALISFNGSALQLNPAGDLLALLAAFIWACYSILTRKISSYGYNTILTTRRVFLYGLLFMIPVLLLSDPVIDFPRFADRTNLLNLLFLGLGASALCFVTWNSAVRLLGAVRTSVYIYLTPVITIVTSVLILHEPFTWMTGIGTVLTLAGLVLSEGRVFRHKNQK